MRQQSCIFRHHVFQNVEPSYHYDASLWGCFERTHIPPGNFIVWCFDKYCLTELPTSGSKNSILTWKIVFSKTRQNESNKHNVQAFETIEHQNCRRHLLGNAVTEPLAGQGSEKPLSQRVYVCFDNTRQAISMGKIMIMQRCQVGKSLKSVFFWLKINIRPTRKSIFLTPNK